MAVKVSYQWSCDGEIEICLKELVCIDNSVECYHCGSIIPVGLATRLTNLSDSSVYTLHNLCAEKSCRSE